MPSGVGQKNEENLGQLNDAINSLKSNFSDFDRSFLAEDPVELKKTLHPDEQMKGAQGFLALGPKFERVREVCSDLTNRHQGGKSSKQKK